MRFMVIVHANKDTEAGVMPTTELLTAMGKFNEEMCNAGVMQAGEGLHPTAKGARIINLVSGASNRPLFGWAAYCASKAGLLMLSRSADLEGAPVGIRCFAFAPGLVDTAMQGSIRLAAINEVSDIPREKLAPPELPAGIIAWLASGAADDLAGQYIDIRQEGLLTRAGLG